MVQLRTVVAALCVTFLLTLAAHASYEGDPRDVYGRLIAPCCWTQTLDIHDSPLATELRIEIADRLVHGEAASAIEDDLAQRFGDRIRAVPPGEDPRETMALTVVSVMVFALCALLIGAWRWSRRQAPLEPQPRFALSQDEYDARLDQELDRTRER